MAKVIVRSRFSVRDNVGVNVSARPGRGAKQAMKKECDINFIMSRYAKTGVLAHVNPGRPVYADMPSFSFHEALNFLQAAQDDFASLPAKVRKEFGNDPAKFLDFATKPENLDKMRELGLAPPKEPAPAPAPAPGAPAQ